MERKHQIFRKQKPAIYFDENIPDSVIKYFKASTFSKKYKFVSANESGNAGKSDSEQFIFCRKNNLTLVTSDNDFSDDKLYPFNGMPGVVIVKASEQEHERMKNILNIFFNFAKDIPFPKNFLGDTKFVLSTEGVIMRGRDFKSGIIKTFRVFTNKTTVLEIMQEFSYFA